MPGPVSGLTELVTDGAAAVATEAAEAAEAVAVPTQEAMMAAAKNDPATRAMRELM